jgi:hypothetical protein
VGERGLSRERSRFRVELPLFCLKLESHSGEVHEVVALDQLTVAAGHEGGAEAPPFSRAIAASGFVGL